MRVRTFHSAFAVVAILASIALLSVRDRGDKPQPQPSPRAQRPVVAPEPVVYTAPGGRAAPAVELYARRMTRVVLVSTMPMGPLLNAIVPFEPSSDSGPSRPDSASDPSSGQGP